MPLHAFPFLYLTGPPFDFASHAERLAAFHASQCGFCTPGMAVACQAALTKCKDHGTLPTAEAMRDAVDGNLCRWGLRTGQTAPSSDPYQTLTPNPKPKTKPLMHDDGGVFSCKQDPLQPNLDAWSFC